MQMANLRCFLVGKPETCLKNNKREVWTEYCAAYEGKEALAQNSCAGTAIVKLAKH